jgi:hypothetical protein
MRLLLLTGTFSVICMNGTATERRDRGYMTLDDFKM